MDRLRFKIAAQPWEFEQIHRLNYRTFVAEIPQHPPNPEQRLVDKFHDQNTYFICLNGQELVGMVAGRTQRPFSLDGKLENLDSYLPASKSLCEVRLLSVKPAYRNGRVLCGLVQRLIAHYADQGCDLAVISGAASQLKLYKHMGWAPFGPTVGAPEAPYQPMYLTLKRLKDHLPWFRTRSQEANFLPGPVQVKPAVWEAFCQQPTSHRSGEFVEDVQKTKRLLCELTAARNVELMLGSGTLANDVVAGQLSLHARDGLILSNGEFGERLVDHATRFGLHFHVLRVDWGEPLRYDLVEQYARTRPELGWLWSVHCETSTGVLNDLPRLARVCRANDVRLCVDCISSLGTTLVDLRDVHLATGVSAKGLASLPGLAIVFSDHRPHAAPRRLPRYLDLGFYAAKDGVPFTTSSNLHDALRASLERANWPERFAEIATLSAWLRNELRSRGFRIVAPDSCASPAVVTVPLPELVDSERVGRRLRQQGYLLSYSSEYLRARNWVQICLMGECTREALESALDLLPRPQLAKPRPIPARSQDPVRLSSRAVPECQTRPVHIEED